MVLLSACSEEVDENAPRGYDEESIAEFNSNEKYNYDKDFEIEESNPPNMGWLARFFGAIFSFLSYFINGVLGYIFLIGLVVLLVYLVIKNSDAIFVRKKLNTYQPVKITESEHIEDIDYDQLLAKALNKKDYTLAVRYHFLKCLKLLQQAKLINWHQEKTNYEYLMEVPKPLYNPLNQLIYIYEYVWYGKFDATHDTYNRLVAEAKKLQPKGDEK